MSGNGHGADQGILGKGKIVVVRDESKKKTFYEARIPFSSLDIVPVKNKTLSGFSFVIFDDDEGTGQMYYYYLSRGITNGKYPRYFKKTALVE